MTYEKAALPQLKLTWMEANRLQIEQMHTEGIRRSSVEASCICKIFIFPDNSCVIDNINRKTKYASSLFTAIAGFTGPSFP